MSEKNNVSSNNAESSVSATTVDNTSSVVVPKTTTTNNVTFVTKPDKTVYDKQVKALNVEIETFQEQLQSIRKTMDVIQAGQGGNPELNAKMKLLKDQIVVEKGARETLVASRNQLSIEIKRIRNEQDASIKSQKAMKSQLKYSSVQEIDDALSRLHYDQSTRSMSLMEEKNLIKEMETLSASKKMVAKFSTEKNAVDASKGDIKTLRMAHDLKNDELTKKSSVMDDLYKALNVCHEEKNNSEERGKYAELLEERKSIKPQLDEVYNSLRSIRNDFKEKNDEYYNHVRAAREAKKEELKAEEEKIKAEYQAKLAVYEKEMEKIHVYQDEIDLCGALVKYLKSTYAKELSSPVTPVKNTASKCCDSNIALDGMQPMKRKEEDYMGTSFGGKKKKFANGNGNKKKKKAVSIALPLAHVDTFGKLGMLPPSSMDDLSASIMEIEAKKVHYLTLTVREDTKKTKAISPKANANNAKKINKTKYNGGKKTNYNATQTSDFPSLGESYVVASVSNGDNSWGPGSAPPAAPVEAMNGEIVNPEQVMDDNVTEGTAIAQE